MSDRKVSESALQACIEEAENLVGDLIDAPEWVQDKAIRDVAARLAELQQRWKRADGLREAERSYALELKAERDRLSEQVENWKDDAKGTDKAHASLKKEIDRLREDLDRSMAHTRSVSVAAEKMAERLEGERAAADIARKDEQIRVLSALLQEVHEDTKGPGELYVTTNPGDWLSRRMTALAPPSASESVEDLIKKNGLPMPSDELRRERIDRETGKRIAEEEE